MSNRKDDVKISHFDFQNIMKDYARMAIETGNQRLAAKCATICMDQVVTGVYSGDEDKKLCYDTDKEYLSIARDCLMINRK